MINRYSSDLNWVLYRRELQQIQLLNDLILLENCRMSLPSASSLIMVSLFLLQDFGRHLGSARITWHKIGFQAYCWHVLGYCRFTSRREEPQFQSLSLLLGVEVDIAPSKCVVAGCRSKAGRGQLFTRVGEKSSERMLNHSNSERVRHFYFIFSVLIYFLSLKNIGRFGTERSG